MDRSQHELSARPLTSEEWAIVERHLAVAAQIRLLVPGQSTCYFARLQVRPTSSNPRFVGHRAVREVFLGAQAIQGQDFAMIHWRDAPLARVFYACGLHESYEIEVDGRVLEGEVLAREWVEFRDDELFSIVLEHQTLVRISETWRAYSRPSAMVAIRPLGLRRQLVGGMEAQLDPQQQAIVDLPADRDLLLLGAAGFGKTTVALARLVRLARAAAQSAKEVGERAAAGEPWRALVVVPNAGLKNLCVHLLERMGAVDVVVSTFESWINLQAQIVFPKLTKRRSHEPPPAVARIKRHPELIAVLPKILEGTPAMQELWAHEDRVRSPREWLYHLFGDRKVLAPLSLCPRFPIRQREIEEVALHTRRQFELTTEELFADVEAKHLRTLDGHRIDAQTPDQDAGTVDLEDLAVIFALHHLEMGSDASVHGKLETYNHIVIDEAQEFAALEMAVLGRACRTHGSITMSGDANQQVDETAFFTTWDQQLSHLKLSDRKLSEVQREVLLVSYRCPKAVEALARAIVEPSFDTSTLRADPQVVIHGYPHVCALYVSIIDELLRLKVGDPQATIAVIFRHEASARLFHQQVDEILAARLCLAGDFDFRPGIKITCVAEVKGLEFDYVVLIDADRSTYPIADAARRSLYVAMTRARYGVWLAWAGAISPLLTTIKAVVSPESANAPGSAAAASVL